MRAQSCGRICTDLSERFSNLSPEGRPVGARNLTFEDRRTPEPRVSIFLAVRGGTGRHGHRYLGADYFFQADNTKSKLLNYCAVAVWRDLCPRELWVAASWASAALMSSKIPPPAHSQLLSAAHR